MMTSLAALTVSEPLGAGQGARHAASQAPPRRVPPLAQCGDEGAQRRKRLLSSSSYTLAQEDDIITTGYTEEEFLLVYVEDSVTE